MDKLKKTLMWNNWTVTINDDGLEAVHLPDERWMMCPLSSWVKQELNRINDEYPPNDVHKTVLLLDIFDRAPANGMIVYTSAFASYDPVPAEDENTKTPQRENPARCYLILHGPNSKKGHIELFPWYSLDLGDIAYGSDGHYYYRDRTGHRPVSMMPLLMFVQNLSPDDFPL